MVGFEVDAAVSVAVWYSAARFEVVVIDLRLRADGSRRSGELPV
jgi:hypothetical protein